MNKIWIILVASVILLTGSFFLFISLQKKENPAQLTTQENYELIQTAGTGSNYKNINSVQLAEMLKSKDFIFINTHIPYEGEIELTDLFFAYNEIEQNVDKLPPYKNTKIVLYCRSGRMSEIAAKTMVKLGYTNIWNHTGGMIEWEKQGHKLTHRQS